MAALKLHAWIDLLIFFSIHASAAITASSTNDGPTQVHPSPTVADAASQPTSKFDSQGYNVVAELIDPHADNHYLNFFRFVTRPDIDAPRWNITTYDADALAPGYWFATPYEKHDEGYDNAWVGPNIYDGNGELVWSGAPQFGNSVCWNFRATEYHGHDVLTFNLDDEAATILDSHYNIVESFNPLGKGRLNMHEFNVVDNGTRFLIMKTDVKEASKSFLHDMNVPHCQIRYNGFEEQKRHGNDSKLTFDWTSEGTVGMDESGIGEEAVITACEPENGHGLDYIHANSIDKFPDGDFLYSARHCHTVYKISARDGSIVWRFGGRHSDFKYNDRFIGQHAARVHLQNDTHTMISLLDNAAGPISWHDNQRTSSRGLLILLRTDTSPMTAETVTEFHHPDNALAKSRGNVQLLPNGNALVGWAEHTLLSEYDQSGRLLQRAELKPVLHTYRTFKSPWAGHPTQPPDIYSEVSVDAQRNTATTSIHVSWNGATSVSKWNFYKTDRRGKKSVLLASVPRKGFETAFYYPGFTRWVVAEAVDHHGKALGESIAKRTMVSSNAIGHPLLREEGATFWASPSLIFLAGVLSCAAGCLLGTVIWGMWRLRKSGRCSQRNEWFWNGWVRKGPRYQQLRDDKLAFAQLDDIDEGSEENPEEYRP